MRNVFFVVLFAVPECLANPRYGLMSGQVPLGDEYASFTSITAQECGEFCGARNSPALVYNRGTSSCICYAPVKGYAEAADASQLGYIRVDDSSASCMSVAEHQAIIVSMVYGAAACPYGFDGVFGSGYCESATYGNKTQAECEKYGAFVLAYDVSYDPPHCHLYVNGTVV